jgi:hypothetical protein
MLLEGQQLLLAVQEVVLQEQMLQHLLKQTTQHSKIK